MIIFLGPMTFGAILCYPSPSFKAIQKRYNLKEDSLVWSFYNSISSLTAIVGPFVSNFVLKWQKGSQRNTMFFLALSGIVFWLLNCLTKVNIWLGIIDRGFLGVVMGAFSSLDPMYLVEIAPKGASGFFGSLNQIGIVVGVILFDFVGPSMSYIALNFLGAGIDLLLSLLIWILPQFLDSNGKNDLELNDQDDNQDVGVQASPTITSPGQKLCQGKNFGLLCIGFGLMFFQQFCGINAIITNLASIMDSAGMKMDGNYQAGIATSSQLIAVIVSSLVVDKFGRRKVLVTSTIIILVFLLIFGLNEKFHWTNVLPLLCIFLYQFGFGLGMGPIPWFIIPEYFNSDVRSLATTLVSASNWIFAFIIIFLWPLLKKGFGFFGAIIFFAIVTFVSILFEIFIVRDPHEVKETQSDHKNVLLPDQ